jgi:hypothetical protein
MITNTQRTWWSNSGEIATRYHLVIADASLYPIPDVLETVPLLLKTSNRPSTAETD